MGLFDWVPKAFNAMEDARYAYHYGSDWRQREASQQQFLDSYFQDRQRKEQLAAQRQAEADQMKRETFALNKAVGEESLRQSQLKSALDVAEMGGDVSRFTGLDLDPDQILSVAEKRAEAKAAKEQAAAFRRSLGDDTAVARLALTQEQLAKIRRGPAPPKPKAPRAAPSLTAFLSQARQILAPQFTTQQPEMISGPDGRPMPKPGGRIMRVPGQIPEADLIQKAKELRATSMGYSVGLDADVGGGSDYIPNEDAGPNPFAEGLEVPEDATDDDRFVQANAEDSAQHPGLPPSQGGSRPARSTKAATSTPTGQASAGGPDQKLIGGILYVRIAGGWRRAQ